MLKQLFALVRGRAHEAAEEVVDRNALIILRQQIRDCADAIAAARRAVAIAIAQNEQEVAQYKKLVARIDDLETRAIARPPGRQARARPRSGRNDRDAGSGTRLLRTTRRRTSPRRSSG